MKDQAKDTEYKMFYLRNLIYPGTFLLNSKIYFYAGSTINPNTAYNHLVYSINIDSDNLDLEIEPFFFPIALNNPQSSSNSKFSFICGGMNEELRSNTNCYIFDTKKGFRSIPSKNLEILENYPPLCTDKYIIIMSFPKFAIKLKHTEG